MRDMQVIGISEVVLQALQAPDECLYLVLIEQTLEQLDSVAQLLGRDPQLVSLPRRRSAEAFAAFAQVAPPPIEQTWSQVADRRGQQRPWPGPVLAPGASFEPVREAQHLGGVSLRMDCLRNPIIGGPARFIECSSQLGDTLIT